MSTITASAALTSGTCGENLTWTFDELTGKLTISGTGAMDNYSSGSRPWEGYEDNIRVVIINDGITSIGSLAFNWCVNLTSVSISDSVTSIGDSAFRFCTSLSKVTIPNSVTLIGDSVFMGCDCLTEVIIPESVTAIGNSVFFYCENLTSITIPNSVKSIGNSAFLHCESLTNIIIPDSVVSIGDSAFLCCESLTSITISNSVTLIEYGAFYECTNLLDVYYIGTEKQWKNISINNSDNSNAPLLNAKIHFLDDEHTHHYKFVITAPTCTEQGYTTYTCECGDTYIDNYIDAHGHTPANAVEENYVAPTCTENGSKEIVVYCSVCNEEISHETVIISATGHADNDGDGYCDADNELLDPTVECGCNCHRSGISRFFFNFILFFQRIFGANKTCDCGVAHY